MSAPAPPRTGGELRGDGVGVYLHVPFCLSRCPYCDFNTAVVEAPPCQACGAALDRELAVRAELFGGVPLRSVYFGGGTPSLAPAPWIATRLAAITDHFPSEERLEITVEANPGSIDAHGLRALAAAGVNRLSIGWQSTHDSLLATLGRKHTAADSRALLEAARAQFDNIGVDLIFAVPGQTMAMLDADLEQLLAYRPQHLSIYALTFHTGTPFERWRRKGLLHAASEELEVAMMERIETRLTDAGYDHYEVSNYALPGSAAVHNSLYWLGAPYLGLGPGAHSFLREGWDRGQRWENRRDTEQYLGAWSHADDGGVPLDGAATIEFVEHLTEEQLRAERFMCAMRLANGIDLAEVQGGDSEAVAAAVEEGRHRGWLRQEGSRIVPTCDGMRHADALGGLFFG